MAEFRVPSVLKRVFRQKIRLMGASPAEVERAEYAFYIDNLREGMVVFDVGANIGETTLFFSRFIGESGKVHAFEASSATFGSLKTVCAQSCRKNMVLNNLAVSEKAGKVRFSVYEKDYWGFNSLAERPLEKYGINVKPVAWEDVDATTIDGYCKMHGITRIDLLKIDVEGAELQVLRGAEEMLKNKKIICCIFEFGQTTFDMGNRPQDIKTFLEKSGYSVRNVVEGDPVFPGSKSVESAQFSMMVAKI